MARSPSPAGKRIGGMEDRKVESQSYTPRKAPARFRLPAEYAINNDAA